METESYIKWATQNSLENFERDFLNYCKTNYQLVFSILNQEYPNENMDDNYPFLSSFTKQELISNSLITTGILISAEHHNFFTFNLLSHEYKTILSQIDNIQIFRHLLETSKNINNLSISLSYFPKISLNTKDSNLIFIDLISSIFFLDLPKLSSKINFNFDFNSFSKQQMNQIFYSLFNNNKDIEKLNFLNNHINLKNYFNTISLEFVIDTCFSKYFNFHFTQPPILLLKSLINDYSFFIEDKTYSKILSLAFSSTSISNDKKFKDSFLNLLFSTFPIPNETVLSISKNLPPKDKSILLNTVLINKSLKNKIKI